MKKGYIIAMAGMLTAGMVAQNALHVYKKDGSIVDYTVAELDSIVFEKPGTVIAETPTLTKSGTGASSQTVTEGNAITEFSYSWTNATNVTVTGLPTGVNATINTANSSVTIAGTPTTAGTYNYTISTVSSAATQATVNGTITVTSSTVKPDTSTSGTDTITPAVVTPGTVTTKGAVTMTEVGGWMESGYAEWSLVSNATSYNVYCKAASDADSKYTKIDEMLVRNYGSYARADLLGLAAGTYNIKVVPVVSGSESGTGTVGTFTALAHDRAGYAFKGSVVPGAYNADGTLKDNAVVIYLTEKNKNSMTLAVTTSSKGSTTTAKGLDSILLLYKKGYDTRPLDIRMIGNVTDATYMEAGDYVIENSNGTTGITFEGVGEDATANGWGIRIKNANYVEVRNLGFMNCNSSEGDNVGLQQGDNYVWVHNCDMFYGDAGSDADQVKGDGALDCKKSNYCTFSYNHFWDNGKCNLLGLSEGVKSTDSNPYYVTYHHNWYDHSDSRHPRCRYWNAHVYNNFYDGNAKYGSGATLGSSMFMESNYFRNCKFPMLSSMQGTDVYAAANTRDTKNNPIFSSEDGGMVKAYNNSLNGKYTFIAYGASDIVTAGTTVTASSRGIDTKTDFDAYVVTSRNTTVPSSITTYQGANYYSNFDSNGGITYNYTADQPIAAVKKVKAYAGRVNGGDFKWTFDDSTDDESYAVNTGLKTAITNYKTTMVSDYGE